jgi:hypothetical protein
MQCGFISCDKRIAKYNVGHCKLCSNNFCNKHSLNEIYKWSKEENHKEKLRKKHVLDLLENKTISTKIIHIT